jgi:response regulator of citrate/malate metabolism
MISVLIVEDDTIAAEALEKYVVRVPGFVVAGAVRTGAETLRRLALERVDLVLLDIYLPDMSGIDVIRAMRAAGKTNDVMVVTRAMDLTVVHTAASYGIVHYLVKPFTFGALRDKLERYRGYHDELSAARSFVTQADIDRILADVHATGASDLPKGMSRESLHAVAAIVRDAAGEPGLSAAEVGTRLGASRVTARRYLEYLAEAGFVVRRTRYGGAHRPKVEYRWRAPGTDRRDPSQRG